MKGITFGNLHSWRGLHMIMANKTIGPPCPESQ